MSFKSDLDRYDAIVKLCTGIERKGKSVPYTSANGHMFSFLNKDGELGMRFSKAVQEKYFTQFNTGPLTSHGSIMKGYILITEVMFADMDLLANLLKESHKYVMGLDPK